MGPLQQRAKLQTQEQGELRGRLDFKHRAVYDGKVNERKLQEWIDEMQPKVHVERQLETREIKWMESEDSSSQKRRAWEKLWQPRAFSTSPYLSSLQR